MRIAIRVDASSQIGTGHFMRCLALSYVLKQQGAEIRFISRHIPVHLRDKLASKGYEFAHINCPSDGTTGKLAHSLWLGTSQVKDAAETTRILCPQSWDWLIVDHYALDAEWESTMRSDVGRIMVIDDLADRFHDCDLLLDQNLCEGFECRYDGLVPDDCVRLLGPRYALLRPEFDEKRKTIRHRDGRVRRILVFFGGSDLTNETAKALEAIRLLKRFDITVDVVVGASNLREDLIRKICHGMPNINFHLQVENMAELMSVADLFIGASGATTWERCILGLPSLVLVVADNQREVAEAMGASGSLLNLGWHANVTSGDILEALRMILAYPNCLVYMSERSLAIMGGPDAALGAPCVTSMMASLYAGS